MARYVWFCGWENGASSWIDSERCTACSRKPVKTKEAAQKALDAHLSRTGHYSSANHIRKLEKYKRW